MDHIPELLDQIGDVAEELAFERRELSAFETAQRHALDRLDEGFDVADVVDELSMLRDCVLAVWERENVTGSIAELRMLDRAIDRAIKVSVARYAEARERTLAGMDRISAATLESRSVGDLLQRLLTVFKETTPAVDTAAFVLLEGDGLLRVRAAVGLEEEVERGFATRMGQGFTGRIALERTPMALRAAYLDPLVESEVVRQRRVRALYGVPLVHGAELIGVAHMGSLSAHEFSQEDRQFFNSMVSRATVGIAHLMLRQELADSEERFKHIAIDRERTLSKLESLLAASPVGIAFIDRDLRYLRINDALAEMNHVPAAAHVGRHVREILPDIADELEPVLQRVIDTGEPVLNFEAQRLDPRDPTRAIWVLVNYFPVRRPSGEITGVGGVVLDVTDAHRAREALRAEQQLLQSIIEHAPAAIWVKDHEGRIVLANHRLASLFGHRFEDVIFKRSMELLPPDLAREHDEHDRIVLDEDRAIEVEERMPDDAGLRTFLSIKFPIPHEPPLVGGIATEITERKRIEGELRDAMRMREDVLAIVSHDLRNPLGTVQLSASILASQLGADNRARRHLEMIARSCTRMENLISDLLDTANIRAGRLQLELAREVVESVVSEALDLHAPLVLEKGLQLRRETNLDGIEVLCDRNRILQVFANLIGNALKFCRAGDTITITGEREGEHARFSVADTGPGIHPDLLPHLFDAYWSAAEHARRGSGLGLYIARGIVEGHGGRLWVESRPGSGARFFFTLPLAPVGT